MTQCRPQNRRVRRALATAILLAWMVGSITRPPAGLATPPTSSPDLVSASQPDGAPTTAPAAQSTTAPEELESFPPPAVGQFAIYSCTSAGPASRLRQAIEAIGAAGEITVSEQVLVNNQPAGKPTTLRLPRFVRWPAPMQGEQRTVRYSREKLDLAGQNLDCVVLTIESRSAGVARVMKQWVCPAVPVTHLARLVVTTDGREVFRQELTEFGVANK